ncbi:MAG: DNA mismatch repair protein MutS, partial [Bdellovibrionales bacterium]|nr:DNA mismatch repair protein MutS [Bdellovibrionales bacterium]
TRFFLQGQSRNLPPDSCRLKEELKRSFVSPLFYKHLLLHSIFWPLGLGLFVLWALGFSPISGPLVFGIYCLYSVLSLGSATKGFAQAEALSLDLETLIPVFQWLEKNSDLCKELAPQSWKLKPTQELKRAHKILVCLSIQAHPLVFLIINAFFPWTYLWTWELEKWRENHYAKFSSSLDEIENLEAIGSMALFHYYQSPSFPGLSDDIGLKVKKVFHPLISRTKAVANDFTMTSPTQLTLITGSNMSGKSTFLRTLGINQHLAMIGCPVFAESFQTFVGPVLTCLQIKDSLQEGYSSFYYEVKRVKLILDLASEGKSFLYLIDEIFRGTNNRERLLGSQAVIRELLRSNQALGLISTHDLELTQLENEFPALHNGHFRDEVREDQPGLHFSYRYQQGPCPTTNALKIMAAEGLPVPLQFA